MNVAKIGIRDMPARELSNAKQLLDSQGFCLLDKLISPPTVSALATRLADVIGIDYYPRHAVLGVGPVTAYLDGHASPRPRRRAARLLHGSLARHQRVFITEGQSEPWEKATTPPSPQVSGMWSCLPEHVIGNYNRCIHWSQSSGVTLGAYLFWGAEYWLRRQRSGDQRYLKAFARVLERA